MLKSSIANENGVPALFVEGRRETAIGYTTYFEERSRYEDFINAGYRIFFVNASFTTAPINNFTGFSPFRKGIFEDPENWFYTALVRENYQSSYEDREIYSLDDKLSAAMNLKYILCSETWFKKPPQNQES